MDTSKPIPIAYDGSDGAKGAIAAAAMLFSSHPAIVLSVWHSAALDHCAGVTSPGRASTTLRAGRATILA